MGADTSAQGIWLGNGWLMRVLLDDNIHQNFLKQIVGHELTHARQMGWAERENGDLISAAEGRGFEVLITADKQMQYQQTISSRRLSIVVLDALFIRWDHIVPLVPQVQALLDEGILPGSFIRVSHKA